MKLWLIWFYLSAVFTCYCAHLDPAAYSTSYEELLNREEDPLSEVSSEESSYSGQYPTSDDEDPFAFEDWFSTTASLDENVAVDENSTEIPEEFNVDSFAFEDWFSTTASLDENFGADVNSTKIPEELTLFNEMPIVQERTDEMESTLRIEYTPYSALLYQEDEFGLEFLCPGYWLRKDMLLIRGDCWAKDMDLNIEDTVAEVFLKSDLNLMVLRLLPNLSNPQEHELLHLANVSDHFPVSVNDCTLYVLQEDYALFELYSWAIRPLPFKRAKALCDENHICLRTRPSAAYGLDYALLCDQSFAGMLTTDRTKYERVFGKLTLMDLSVAKPWIDQILEETEGENEAQEEHVTTFLSLSLTPMPPAEMHIHEGDAI